MTRGWWGVAAVRPKHPVNVGSLWRSAQVMGADVLVLIDAEARGEMHAKRIEREVAGTRQDYSFSGLPGLSQPSDVMGATRHMPVVHAPTVAALREIMPTARLVGVECPDVAEGVGREAVRLPDLRIYERVIYVLGTEDGGLSRADLEACDDLVYIESAEPSSLNVACAGTVICANHYSRSKRGGQ